MRARTVAAGWLSAVLAGVLTAACTGGGATTQAADSSSLASTTVAPAPTETTDWSLPPSDSPASTTEPTPETLTSGPTDGTTAAPGDTAGSAGAGDDAHLCTVATAQGYLAYVRVADQGYIVFDGKLFDGRPEIQTPTFPHGTSVIDGGFRMEGYNRDPDGNSRWPESEFLNASYSVMAKLDSVDRDGQLAALGVLKANWSAWSAMVQNKSVPSCAAGTTAG